MTDHSSMEGSRDVLATAVRRLTSHPPVLLDARHFMTGGQGRVGAERGTLRLQAPGEVPVVNPAAVIIYEIPPAERRRFEDFQHLLHQHGTVSLGLDADAWRTATEKDRTAERFTLDGVPHMESITLSGPTEEQTIAAFGRLGRDVWARPTVGMGGDDVFHIRTDTQLRDAARHYAASGLNWLIARDAGNFNRDGRRHQFRVVVLDDHVIRACEHVQPDPDAPCNESRGAVSTLLDIDDLSPDIYQPAIAATKSLGLRFGGVDLAVENGGVVFEVNVHPAFGTLQALETVAVPYVQAHLDML
ncbi:ATP-grasp domain-containing protein [Thermomonospora umbrina]|uniref:RimK-like ATP-grasp domain-containing protein n=1 Tax=Thermomonospora umbrina TaxID=111806 RepID=A0A3D9SGK2_9ACTN|nr:hypothetical protein [Thermomonospora umbrina]REE95032.1 RimK-like ATP-grasp domain-containing protein [Thermomonospora umbrina]